jgi:dolichol-phosphate mannosyltransferase
LEPLVNQLLALPLSLHILVVDDQSPDGTGELADLLAEQHSGVLTVIHRSPPRGRGLAGIEGLARAAATDYDYVIEMDADLSHPVNFIPKFLESITADPPVDVVIGSRHLPGSQVEGWPRWRYLNSAVANRIARLLLGLPPGDITSGYRCFRRKSLVALPWHKMLSTGPAVVEEILFYGIRAGWVMREIPITFVDRVAGESKVSVSLILRWIREIWRVRRGR